MRRVKDDSLPSVTGIVEMSFAEVGKIIVGRLEAQF